MQALQLLQLSTQCCVQHPIRRRISSRRKILAGVAAPVYNSQRFRRVKGGVNGGPVQVPTNRKLYVVALHQAIPFVVFGMGLTIRHQNGDECIQFECFFYMCFSFFMNSWYVNLQVPTNLGGRGGALLRKIHQVKTFNLNGL